MTADLLSLASEVEALETPSREMDARVWCAVKADWRAVLPPAPPGWVTATTVLEAIPTARYTASLDAVMALVAELLSGCVFSLHGNPPEHGGGYEAVVWAPPEADIDNRRGDARLAPCALLAAMLRAVAATTDTP
jgi:hypothetical protein